MSKPIIAIDVDDVLTRGVESLRLEVNRRLGTNLQSEHYRISGEYRTYFDQVWQSNGLAGRISMARLSPQMEVDQSHILPAKDAAKVLRKLKERYELVVVTAREQPWKQATLVWLDQHYSGIFTRTIFSGDSPDALHKSKGQICREIGAAWLIDDNTAHAETAIEAGVSVVLFGEYGWQQTLPHGVAHCKDWVAVLEYFDGR